MCVQASGNKVTDGWDFWKGLVGFCSSHRKLIAQSTRTSAAEGARQRSPSPNMLARSARPGSIAIAKSCKRKFNAYDQVVTSDQRMARRTTSRSSRSSNLSPMRGRRRPGLGELAERQLVRRREIELQRLVAVGRRRHLGRDRVGRRGVGSAERFPHSNGLFGQSHPSASLRHSPNALRCTLALFDVASRRVIARIGSSCFLHPTPAALLFYSFSLKFSFDFFRSSLSRRLFVCLYIDLDPTSLRSAWGAMRSGATEDDNTSSSSFPAQSLNVRWTSAIAAQRRIAQQSTT